MKEPDLDQRIHDSPDIRHIIDLGRKTAKLTIANIVYSIILTGLIIAGIIQHYRLQSTTATVKELEAIAQQVILSQHDACERDNLDKATNLQAWIYILTLFPDTADKSKVLNDRIALDTAVDCDALFPLEFP